MIKSLLWEWQGTLHLYTCNSKDSDVGKQLHTLPSHPTLGEPHGSGQGMLTNIKPAEMSKNLWHTVKCASKYHNAEQLNFSKWMWKQETITHQILKKTTILPDQLPFTFWAEQQSMIRMSTVIVAGSHTMPQKSTLLLLYSLLLLWSLKPVSHVGDSDSSFN